MPRSASRPRTSPAQALTDPRQVVPAMPDGVVLNDVLSGYRRAEAQREGRCPVQLVVGEPAYRDGSLATIPPQKLKGGVLGYIRLFARVVGIQPVDNLPRHVRNRITIGDGSCQIDLDRVNGGDMVHDTT